MALFAGNPLALSVPDHAFESWLRESGYLEVLDDRANLASTATTSSPTSISSSSPNCSQTGGSSDRALRQFRRLGVSVFSSTRTALSILTVNPFAKLTSHDFSGETPPWTVGFIGPSYSWPAGPSQARMRIQENVKRYARNYAFLSLLIFACSLYQMPKSLLGLVGCLALWEGLWFCCQRWNLEERLPVLRNLLLYATQFLTASILYCCKLQVAVILAAIVSYVVMIMHASLRKLTPSKHSTVGTSQNKIFQQKKHRSINVGK